MPASLLKKISKFFSRSIDKSDEVGLLKDLNSTLPDGTDNAHLTVREPHSAESIEYVGELHLSNPNGIYLEVPNWPAYTRSHLAPEDITRIPSKIINVTNSYDDQSIEFFNLQKIKPTPLVTPDSVGLWAFSGNVVRCNPDAEAHVDPERLAMLMECCIDSFINSKRPSNFARKPIPRNVKLFVWQRDQGRCVECGAQANLEFDHVIPVIKGGSSTERNIRLLCETCNRRKGPNL